METHIEFPFDVLFYSLPFSDNLILVVDQLFADTVISYDYQKKLIVNSIKINGVITSFISSGNFACACWSNGITILCCNPLVSIFTLNTIGSPGPVSIVSTNEDPNHLIMATEEESIRGNLVIRKLPGPTTPIIIRSAHKAPITFIALSPDGRLAATASETGTIVRLWSTETGKLTRETRRGFLSASIAHIAFSSDSAFFSVASNHLTAHVFRTDCGDREGYFLTKADVKVSLQSDSEIRAIVLGGGTALCALASGGACIIYALNLDTGEGIIQSEINIPVISNAICGIG